jgi:NitT/TauT family transport system substrate-binding protein
MISQGPSGNRAPSACVLAQQGWVASHKDLVQKVVDALVATMHGISTYSAAQIAAKMPRWGGEGHPVGLP